MGEQQKSSRNHTAEHWYSRYNQIYRKRMAYMEMGKTIQNRLKLTTEDSSVDCLRSKAALQQPNGPVLWNHKACTCHKCKATTMTTYYTGNLYLNSQIERNGAVNNSGLLTSRSMDDQLMARSDNNPNKNSFQALVQNSHSTTRHWHPAQALNVMPPSLSISSDPLKPIKQSQVKDDSWKCPPHLLMCNAPSIPSKESHILHAQNSKLPPIEIKRHTRAPPGPILPLLGR